MLALSILLRNIYTEIIHSTPLKSNVSEDWKWCKLDDSSSVNYGW